VKQYRLSFFLFKLAYRYVSMFFFSLLCRFLVKKRTDRISWRVHSEETCYGRSPYENEFGQDVLVIFFYPQNSLKACSGVISSGTYFFVAMLALV
jgi:hypothetical protein